MTPRVLFVVGARPNFVKVAPVLHAIAGSADVRVLNTGQHYDEALAGSFLDVLRFPAPDHELEVGSGTHAEQTAAVLVGVERVLAAQPPSVVVVPGDVNSTLAAALAAAKLQIPVAHLESGLRSGDRAMPEELNRILTDQLASLCLCTSQDAVAHLEREGVAGERVALVGNTMIDSLLALEPRAAAADAPRQLGLEPRGYVLVTLHRPSLVDDAARLGRLIDALGELAAELPVVFPVHPRTRPRLPADLPGGLLVTDPLDYVTFLGLEREARLVITDSGGVQEETTVLGVPCLTFRTTTERPITISEGTNRLVGTDPRALLDAAREALAAPAREERPQIPLWDGHAGERAAAALLDLVS